MAKSTQFDPDKRKDVFVVDYRKLKVVEGLNPREEYGNIKDMANSIAANGILQPMTGFRNPKNSDEYFIIDGHRRMKAIELLVQHDPEFHINVPILLRKPTTEDNYLLEMVVKNDGKPFSFYETLTVFKRLLAHGYSHEDILEKTGWSKAHVRLLGQASSFPSDLTALMRSGDFSGTFMMNLYRKHDGDFDAMRESVEKAVEFTKANASKSGEKEGKKSSVSKAKTLTVSTGISAFKRIRKIAAKVETLQVKPERKELFDILTSLLDETMQIEELWKEFFDVDFPTDKKNPARSLRKKAKQTDLVEQSEKIED